MKFVNKTYNTVYLHDLDRYIPYYEDDRTQEASPDDLLKSPYLRSMIIQGYLAMAESGPSRIEQNIVRQLSPLTRVEPNPAKTGITSDHLQIKIRGSFRDFSGYSKVNRNLFAAIASKNIPVQIIPAGGPSYLNQQESRILGKFEKPVADNSILIDSMIPSIAVPFAEQSASYRILNTTIESYTIPDQIVKACNAYDEVWTPTPFCADILSQGGVKCPIFVIPNIVDDRIYKERPDSWSMHPQPKGFVFLSVFNWHYRKGYDSLLHAYLSEFSSEDDVTLLLLVHDFTSKRGEIDADINKMTDHYGKSRAPTIMRCDRIIPEYMMSRFYSCGDCFVLPSRGEGFGLPYAEASMCGLPVIATKCSGHATYLDDDNSILVDVDAISPAPEGEMQIHYWEGQSFADLTSKGFIDSLRYAMRWAVNNPDAAKSKNKILQSVVKNKFSAEAVGRAAHERLYHIWKNLC